MRYILSFILFFCCWCLGSCDSTTESELNTIRTQVLEHYKGCRAIDYLKDYSEQFVSEFYTTQEKADFKAVDEAETWAYALLGVTPSLMKSKVREVEKYWDANLKNLDNSTMKYIKTNYAEAKRTLDDFFEYCRDSVLDVQNAEFQYLISAWSALPLVDRQENKVANALDGYNYEQLIKFGLSDVFSSLYFDKYPQASLNYIFLLVCKAMIDRVEDLKIAYIVPVELPEGSYEIERADIINSTYDVGFNDKTAIECTITTNLSNDKVKYKFTSTDYNSILVGEGMEN